MSDHALGELIADYPSLWQVMHSARAHNEGARPSKMDGKAPLNVGVLSMAMEFHTWVQSCSGMAREVLHAQPRWKAVAVSSGPDPRVMERLVWLTDVWSPLWQADKGLGVIIAKDSYRWHRRILSHIEDRRPMQYLMGQCCPRCGLTTVMRDKRERVCVNVSCMTDGEWHRWNPDA